MSETAVEVQGIELGSVESEGSRERSRTRNSWAVGAGKGSGIHGRRASIRLLGINSEIDEWLEWRVKWGQRGAGVCCFLALICFIVAHAGDSYIVGFQIASVVFAIFVLLCCGVFYYKNISFVVVKRLLCEPNVIVIVVSSLCNCIIDIVRPDNPFSEIFGIIFMILVNAFVSLDAVKVKNRMFVIVIGSIFTLLNIYNIYNLTFGDAAEGVVLFKYTTDGKEHLFMKRSTKRSMFLQILLFGISVAMSAIANDTDGDDNNNNNLNPRTMANEISTLSMKMAMNTIEKNNTEVKTGYGNSVDVNEDEVTMNTFHDLGRLTLESIPKRFQLYELLVKDHPTSAGKNASTSERLQTNDQRSTLVYGEISFNSFAVAMEKVINKYGGLQESGGIFYDIGSGTGKPALAAALLHDFDEVKGIEILDGLFKISLELQNVWEKKVVPLLSDKKAQTRVKFIKGDATVLDWSDATCVFANSTCFDDNLMKRLAEKADACPIGTFFITFTRKLPSDNWEVLEHESHPMSWGHATNVIIREGYIYICNPKELKSLKINLA
eukprot:g5867.t1